MRNRIKVIIILVAFFIQPLLSAMLPVWLVPDLDFCILVVFAVIFDEEDLILPAGLILLLALASDIYSSQYVGATVIALIVVLVMLVLTRKMGNIENILFVLIIATGSTLLYNIAYWVVYAVMSSPYSFMYMIGQLPKTAIINIVLISIALFIAGRDNISKRRDKYFR